MVFQKKKAIFACMSHVNENREQSDLIEETTYGF
jgi:hypothetical protein